MIENLILTEQEIIHILRRNDEQFARKVPTFAFGMDKAIRRNSRPLDEKYSIAIHGYLFALFYVRLFSAFHFLYEPISTHNSEPNQPYPFVFFSDF